MLEINFSDPSKPNYYYPIIIAFLILLLALYFVKVILKNNLPEGVNISLDNRTNPTGLSLNNIFIVDKNQLKIKYLIVFILARIAMWSKAPYMFALFSIYYGFPLSQIGILYLIDSISALFFGPITGGLADIYGRKFFCQIFNVLVIINMFFRLSGNVALAYTAQIITGICSGLLSTTFESWLVSSTNRCFADYPEYKAKFLKKIIKTQNVLDALLSILVSAICALLYSYFGLFAPLELSIIISFIGLFVTQILWEENKLEENESVESYNNSQQSDGKFAAYTEAFRELKKTDVLCIGLIESIYQGVLNIFLFAWQPILESSIEKPINPGFIFTCFVISLILGAGLFEIFTIYVKTNYYKLIVNLLFGVLILFVNIYFIENFLLRLILCAFYNGSTSFFNSLLSIIKSQILVEKHRALLMNIFRIPLNIYVIAVFILVKYISTITIILVASCMIMIALIISMYLYFTNKDKFD